MIRAVTANLGCASASPVSSQRAMAASRWSSRTRPDVDLAFLQEVPETLIEEWEADGFVPATPQGRKYRPRSALLWRSEVASAEEFTLRVSNVPVRIPETSLFAGLDEDQNSL